MSLPAIFGTTLETLPARVPYLATDQGTRRPLAVPSWPGPSALRAARAAATDGIGRGRPCETIPDRDRLAGKPRARHGSLAIVPAGQVSPRWPSCPASG